MRLIDADALTQSWDVLSDGKAFDFYDIDGIANAPTIDAEPVRHGHWIVHVDELFPSESTQECSICHAEEWISLKHENYCPHCGAKMDEVSEWKNVAQIANTFGVWKIGQITRVDSSTEMFADYLRRKNL